MKKEKNDNFIDTKQIFSVKKSIFFVLKNNLEYFKGNFLDLGCGKMPYKDYIYKNSIINKYIGVDIENPIIYDPDIKPDITWDGKDLLIENNSFDTILATELLEHCPYPDIIFKESYRVLKAGGIMFLTTPFVFPLHKSPHDQYRQTTYNIERMAQKAGFKEIDKPQKLKDWSIYTGLYSIIKK